MNSDLLTYLKHGTLSDAASEQVVTALRADLLARVCAGEKIAMEVLAALAQFCFDCEYVLSESSAESEDLKTLEPNNSERDRLMLACYRPDHAEALPLCDIEQLRPVADLVSKSVASQYEEHPYPRWRFLPDGPQADDAIDILIAGCGTGREPLLSARGAPLSRVVGIDLSRTSLAYGLMRAREYGVTNIRFLQGDLRDVHLLGIQFELIKCSGVLHHMADPLEGLLALKKVLKPGGTMRLAVYSTRNRASTYEAIKLRKQHHIPSTNEAIRRFRQEIFALPNTHPAKGVVTSADFYSISGVRDLLFHVQERSYTIPELADLVARSGLKLLQFGVGEKPAARFKDMGFADPSNLALWEQVEDRYPGTFSGMYRIIVGA